jgi:hypothetical protein
LSAKVGIGDPSSLSFTEAGVESGSDVTIGSSDKATANEADVDGDEAGSKIFRGRPRFRFGGSVGSVLPSRLENWTLACCAGVI